MITDHIDLQCHLLMSARGLDVFQNSDQVGTTMCRIKDRGAIKNGRREGSVASN